MSTVAKQKSHGLQTMSPALKEARKYHRWLFNMTEPHLGNRVLEIGCGDGSYTALLQKKERVVGIDIAEDCVSHCKARFSAVPHISIEQVDLLSDQLDWLKNERCDSAFCFNVLEHIETPVEFLQIIRHILIPGGRLVIIVPAHPALYGNMDALAGHFMRYTKKTLREQAREAGWEIERMHYFNSVGGLGWFVSNRLLRPKSLNDDRINEQILFFDKYLLPVSKVGDVITKPFFGQSLFAVLRS